MGRICGALISCLILVVGGFTQSSEKPKRPIEISTQWNEIMNSHASNDGKWFAYWLKRRHGAEITMEAVVRRTVDNEELRFPLGVPEGGNDIPVGLAGAISFSEDSTWVAFHTPDAARPSQSQASERQRATRRVLLFNLFTRKKMEFENVRNVHFSTQSKWIVLHKHALGSQQEDKGGATGSDLILHELATGDERAVANVSEFAFDSSGNWLAWTVDAPERIGNGIYLRNMSTGRITCLDTDTAMYSRLTWTDKGDALTLLKSPDIGNKKLYTVMGFTNLLAEQPTKVVYNPIQDKDFPRGMVVDDAKSPRWMEDLSGILFDIRYTREKNEGQLKDGNEQGTGAHSEKPDLVLWHWRNKDLRSELASGVTHENASSYLCIFRVREKRFIRLADESVKDVEAGTKGKWALGLDTRAYDRNNSFWRLYVDLYVISLKTGERRLALQKKITVDNDRFYKPSPNWDAFLYFDHGQFFIYDIETNKSRNITQNVPTSFSNGVKPPYSYRSAWIWSTDGQMVLLPDAWDIWSVPVHGGRATNLTVNGKKNGIRYHFIRPICVSERYNCTFDEAVDPTKPLYLYLQGDRTKKEGFARLDGKPGAKILLWEDAHIEADVDLGGRSFFKAKFAERFFFTKQTFKDYPDWYVTDGSFQQMQRLTDGNPDRKNFLWPSGYRVVDYTSSNGDKLQASLMLPANYQPGRKYPTIVWIYSNQSRRINRYPESWEVAFEPSVYASNGYAVLLPDIAYKQNDPGMSVVWSVLPAVKAAISTGIVDSNRLGVYGHSFGGYETAFLVTHTDLFKAAIAGAGFSDLASAYNSLRGSDVEKGEAQQGYFESGQGRLGPLWANTAAYLRNSPIYFADKVKTPLLMWHNDKDSAVDYRQSVEYFNALRWLGKVVVMLEYKGEEHGFDYPGSSGQKDCSIKMHEFFDHYLMDKPAPKWLEEGQFSTDDIESRK
jgi:dipeptidyl aminopeptidase/acylaminoacyl peptidase